MLHYLVMLPHYNESKMLPCPLATPEVAVDYCNAAHPANNVFPSYPPPLSNHRSRRTKETLRLSLKLAAAIN